MVEVIGVVPALVAVNEGMDVPAPFAAKSPMLVLPFVQVKVVAPLLPDRLMAGVVPGQNNWLPGFVATGPPGLDL